MTRYSKDNNIEPGGVPQPRKLKNYIDELNPKKKLFEDARNKMNDNHLISILILELT